MPFDLIGYCYAMDSRCLFALSLIFCLEVNSQTFPYVSLSTGERLPNHSYVDLGIVGTMYNNSVWCHTDLSTCCTSQDIHHGLWYFPNGHHLPMSGDIYEIGEPQRVELHRSNSATFQMGIYHCDIPTDAVNDPSDTSVTATVYVGFYTSEGMYINGLL